MNSEITVEENQLLNIAENDLDSLNHSLEDASPKEIINWAWDSFGPEIAASSSFQTQSVPLLHILSQAAPEMTVLFIDTGFHFEETLAFRDRLAIEFNLRIKVIQPQIVGKKFLETYGPLYEQSPDACCFMNKVAPIQRELNGYQAWISGIRRDQTSYRLESPVIGKHPFLEQYKINPLVNWTWKDVEGYIVEHNLPRHPLWEQGYRSIGCAPCTAPVGEAEHPRVGRWPGSAKDECGIHIYNP